jgi:hypothetical protein
MSDAGKTKAFPYCIGVDQKKTDGGLHDEGGDVKTFLALTQAEPAWGRRWFLLGDNKFENGVRKSSGSFHEIIGNKLEMCVRLCSRSLRLIVCPQY